MLINYGARKLSFGEAFELSEGDPAITSIVSSEMQLDSATDVIEARTNERNQSEAGPFGKDAFPNNSKRLQLRKTNDGHKDAFARKPSFPFLLPLPLCEAGQAITVPHFPLAPLGNPKESLLAASDGFDDLKTTSTTDELDLGLIIVKKKGLHKPSKSNKALLWAARKGHLHAINYLMLYNAPDINAKESGMLSQHETPLNFAAVEGYLLICKRLLEAGARVDESNYCDVIPLDMAAEKGRLEICKLLVQFGGAKMDGEKRKLSSVTWANIEGHLDVSEYLITQGANLESWNGDDQHTPLIFAVQTINWIVCEFLLQKGVDVNGTDGKGYTALMHAAGKGNSGLCNLLLQNGAIVTFAKDERGKNAIDLANPKSDVTAVLMSHMNRLAEAEKISKYSDQAPLPKINPSRFPVEESPVFGVERMDANADLPKII